MFNNIITNHIVLFQMMKNMSSWKDMLQDREGGDVCSTTTSGGSWVVQYRIVSMLVDVDGENALLLLVLDDGDGDNIDWLTTEVVRLMLFIRTFVTPLLDD